MAITPRTIKVSELIDKYIYANKGVNVNIRDSASLQSKVLAVAKGGSRIGKVYTWIQVKNRGEDDGVWLQIYESYGKKPMINVETGKPIQGTEGAYVKFTKNILDYATLRDQGLKSEEEKEKEKKEKEEYEDLTWYEKIFRNTGENIKKALPYVAIVYIAAQAVKGKASQSK